MKTKLRKKKRSGKTHYKITLIKFKDLPIGGLFYIKGQAWNGQKAVKISDICARHCFSDLVRFRFSDNDKIKPVFHKGTKNIVVN